MFDRLRSTLFAAAFLAATTPAFAANGIITTVVPLPYDTVATSLVRGPDGNLWFSDFDAVAGAVGYIVRLDSRGTATYYRLPSFAGTGVPAQQTLPLGLNNAPILPTYTRLNSSLVFNWIVYDPTTQLATESGLGTINLLPAPYISEYAAQRPGDPLYSPNLMLEPFAFALASSSQPATVWIDAHIPPSSNSSPAVVAGIPFPFKQTARFRAVRIQNKTAIDCCYFNDLVSAPDGSVWYDGTSAVGRIARSGYQEFSVPGVPGGLAPSSADLWVAGAVNVEPYGGVFTLSYAGSVNAFNGWPLHAFDQFLLAAAPDALWSLSFDGSLGLIYFERMDEFGQWSAYAVASPVGHLRPELTALGIAQDGTIWAGVANTAYAPGAAALISLHSNRVLSAQPRQLTISSGQSVLVSVTETNYIGTAFTSSVPDGCPLSVTPGPNPGTFVVSATATPRLYPCGVTFADPDGISVWLSAVLSNAAGIEPAWHQRMLDVSRRPRILGH